MDQFQQFAQQLQNAVAQVQQMAAGANAQARKAIDGTSKLWSDMSVIKQNHADHAAAIQKLSGAVDGIKTRGASSAQQLGRPDMLTIEEIPGRRIPFDVTVQIAIPAGLNTAVTGTYTLSMDGPFIAVARYATFISSYTFQVTDGQNKQRYVGRSWGRQRPISSVLDINDSMNGWQNDMLATTTLNAQEGCGEGQVVPTPAGIDKPTNRSPFRSMEWDGFISLKNAVYPRQNQQVPSSLWAPGFNQVQQLPVLDYFEKGDIIEFEVQPSHVNNPPAGDVQAIVGGMPYLDSQYDGVEGVMYPSWQCDSGAPDAIQRKPDGILVVGLLGFKILQPPGVRIR